MVVLLMWISCSVFCYFVMKSKGYPSDKCWVHCAGGFLLGLIWLIVVLCKKPYFAQSNEFLPDYTGNMASLSKAPSQENPQRVDTCTKQSNTRIDKDTVLRMLEKIADLKNKGILTEEEFNQKKAELLRII